MIVSANLPPGLPVVNWLKRVIAYAHINKTVVGKELCCKAYGESWKESNEDCVSYFIVYMYRLLKE